ncbi:MerR family transcriptional regulator [Actinocatenispora thailandica]|uniref:MerR family transcriptional regulator n=1 Tax=Actinocatenispora thailandica TaxID=227318 RepID=UPI001EF21646|nr:MerR family transcriptional regulator [Actinocatenispora thailandica]
MSDDERSLGPGETSDDERSLSAGEVARELGVAVTTIRTWDRRYGLGPARRETGRHRRYDGADLARLRLMRQLTVDGVAPAEAARIARQSPAAPAGGDIPEPPTAPTGEVAGLRRAALALDVGQTDRLLAQALRRGVLSAWTTLMAPALIDIGRRHSRTGRYVEVEHLLSNAISRALAAVPRSDARPTVLLACGPDEQHTLALEAVAAALAELGLGSRLLGARVPAQALSAAIRKTGARAVVLWSHRLHREDRRQLEAATTARPRPPVVATCGPGWQARPVPAGVAAPTDLGELLDLLRQPGAR